VYVSVRVVFFVRILHSLCLLSLSLSLSLKLSLYFPPFLTHKHTHTHTLTHTRTLSLCSFYFPLSFPKWANLAGEDEDYRKAATSGDIPGERLYQNPKGVAGLRSPIQVSNHSKTRTALGPDPDPLEEAWSSVREAEPPRDPAAEVERRRRQPKRPRRGGPEVGKRMSPEDSPEGTGRGGRVGEEARRWALAVADSRGGCWRRWSSARASGEFCLFILFVNTIIFFFVCSLKICDF
jgi:hypothetical protein